MIKYSRHKGIYHVAIDTEDGAGVQTFKGADASELIGKLSQAQFYATRKIRSLNHQLKEQGQTLEVILKFLGELSKSRNLSPQVKEAVEKLSTLKRHKAGGQGEN